MKFKKSALIIVLCLSTTTLMAGSKHDKKGYGYGHTQFDYAKVVKVNPVYREVRISSPVTDCWDEPVVHTNNHYSHSNSVGGMAVGGILGGIIGHQVGKGRGNKIATAMGTLIGAQIGHQAANGRVKSNHSNQTAYEERCEVHQRVSYEEIIDGYAVTYRFKGKIYHTEMPYHPGKRLKMRIQFTPEI